MTPGVARQGAMSICEKIFSGCAASRGFSDAQGDFIFLCPRRCWTTFAGTQACRSSVAHGWRRPNFYEEFLLPKGGLEPPRVARHAPQTCASASSDTSARCECPKYIAIVCD